MTNRNTLAGTPSRPATTQVFSIVLVLAVGIQACVPVRWDESTTTANRSSSTPTTSQGRSHQRSKRGNPPFYEVYGVRYYVLDSSTGHQERGVASWYGKKFHGRQTSSGVVYDMYQMTAAHKTLPLPTDVRVTHLGNGKSIVVTVNDRGPFVDNRVIDLSYAAARELDMIGTGTAMVEVIALPVVANQPTLQTASTVPPLLTDMGDTLDAAGSSGQVSFEDDARLYLQVGAFGDAINARQMQQQLQTKGLSNVVIRYDLTTSPTVYRVRLGPIADVAEYDALVQLMGSMQIVETHLVTESTDSQLLDLATTSSGPAGVSASGTLTDG